jgi:hypothetical protein
MTEPNEVEESTWRVRSGAGLLSAAPMSEDRREAFRKEEEKERKAAEFEEQQRREAAIEHRWELERRGVVPRTVGEILQTAAVAQDRQDRRDAKRDADAAVIMGQHPQRLNKWEVKASVAASAAERETLRPARPISAKSRRRSRTWRPSSTVSNASGDDVVRRPPPTRAPGAAPPEVRCSPGDADNLTLCASCHTVVRLTDAQVVVAAAERAALGGDVLQMAFCRRCQDRG